jgi:uncharacterized hydrophobic protein (TIGR00271 family)
MATSVGTVVDDDDLFRRGLRLQFLGGVVAVAAAALFAALLQVTGVVPLSTAEVFSIGEVRERLAPDILSVAVALAAGVAGALSLSSGVSTALVGVMIAAALVPPTAVVGIGLALGTPSSVLGAVTLVLVNFLSINVAALAVLWRMGYRPVNLFTLSEARSALRRRAVVLVVLLVVLSAVLGVLTVSSYRTTVFEDEVQATVESTAADHDLVVVSTDVVYEGVPIRRPTRVSVVLGYPPGTDPPRLASTLAARVNDLGTGPLGLAAPRVAVEVQYVVVERAASPGGHPPPSSLRVAPGRHLAPAAVP